MPATVMPRRTRATLLWLALFCWATGVLRLSSLTPQELPDTGFPLSDKIAHFVVYAVGGWLAATTLRVTRRGSTVSGWLVPAVLLIAAFGVLDEAVQTLTPGRTGGDVYDWIADVLGAAAGAWLALMARRWRRARRSRRTGPAASPPDR